MAVGVAVGLLFPDSGGPGGFHASDLQILSTLFLRMIKVMVVPLVFGMLVVGIAGHGDDLARMGKLALRAFVYFEVVTALALGVGLLVVNVVRPGRGVDLGEATTLPVTPPTIAALSVTGMLERLIPESVVDAAVRNDTLQVTLFAIAFAVALAGVGGPGKRVMLSFCESLNDVMLRFVGFVMACAPVGIGAAIAVTVGHSGLGVLAHLGVLVATLYGALILFGLTVLLPIALVSRVPLRQFWRATREPWLVAFSTASSEAALPLALRNMERLGVPRRIVSFILPAGYSFNMDGTSLYLSLAAVFVAQAAGIDLPLSTQLLLLGTLLITSKGMAAVPRVSILVLAGALAQFGLPLQGVAVILGVDVLMDMGRTSVNLLGNCLAAVVMARWEGSFTPVGDELAVQS